MVLSELGPNMPYDAIQRYQIQYRDTQTYIQFSTVWKQRVFFCTVDQYRFFQFLGNYLSGFFEMNCSRPYISIQIRFQARWPLYKSIVFDIYQSMSQGYEVYGAVLYIKKAFD